MLYSAGASTSLLIEFRQRLLIDSIFNSRRYPNSDNGYDALNTRFAFSYSSTRSPQQDSNDEMLRNQSPLCSPTMVSRFPLASPRLQSSFPATELLSPCLSSTSTEYSAMEEETRRLEEYDSLRDRRALLMVNMIPSLLYVHTR